MTNFEKYKDGITEILKEKDLFIAKDIETGEIRDCTDIDCEKCEFFYKNGNCISNMIEWLASEYQKPISKPTPKLTKAERGFCEAVEEGFITRDQHAKNTEYHMTEPGRILKGCYWSSAYDSVLLSPEYFSFISWEDIEPWSIEDLLKLEVEGND